MKVLLIDNFDSYTHILAYYIWQCAKEKPIVIKNNQFTLDEIAYLEFDRIVISPGPGHPDKKQDFGINKELIDTYQYKKPILGICLGHQGIGSIFGFSIKKLPYPIHGKTSLIEHFGNELFKGVPHQFHAMRYHSLIVDSEGKEKEPIEVIAKEVSCNLIMGIKIKNTQIYGLQFHPESIGSDYGMKIIENFISLKKQKFSKKKTNHKIYFDELTSTLKEEEIFFKLYAKKKYALWLDSSSKGKKASLSIMGAPSSILYEKKGNIYLKKIDEKEEEKIEESPFFFLKKKLDENKIKTNKTYPYPFMGGWMGFFSYEAKKWLGMGKSSKKKSLTTSDMMMMEVRHFLIFDHKNQKIVITSLSNKSLHIAFKEKVVKELSRKSKKYERILLEKEAFYDYKKYKDKLAIKSIFNKRAYFDKIEKIKEKLKLGETYEICLSNEFSAQLKIDDFKLYQILRQVNPAPFGAYIRCNTFSILSSSPEQFVSLDKYRIIQSEPIKGTKSKPASFKENKPIEASSFFSLKDQSELLMITDLIRNDLSKVSEKGSLKVEKLFSINHHPTLTHLSSIIKSKLDKKYDPIDLFINIFPGGSITGAPKLRSMDIINELEQRKRGCYTGSIGYFSYDGSMNFNIAIRTLEKKQSHIIFGSGGAITLDSIKEEEYKEILIKAYSLLKSLYIASFFEEKKL